jgi:hypothetical protein
MRFWKLYFFGQISKTLGRKKSNLKVLTNEKRGGLKVVTFNRSPFKLFTLRFSNNRCRPSCERSKTTRRNLFLSFENIIVSQ